MHANRFTEMFSQPATPEAQPQPAVPMGFAVCPVFVVQLLAAQQLSAIQEIYRQAYEQAQAKARMARIERRFFSLWN